MSLAAPIRASSWFPRNFPVEDVAIGLVAVVIDPVAPPGFSRVIVAGPHLILVIPLLRSQVG